MNSIRKAVFPIAGLGTRFLPATKASPKEMLAVVDKPLIQYAVEEAYAAGIREMIFVTGRSKRAVEDHFDCAYELERELELAGKHELLDVVASVKPADMRCAYVRQPRSLGLGHAVGCAQALVAGEPFAVLLADDLMIGQRPVLRQLVDVFERYGASVLAVQDVPRAETRRYGIVEGRDVRPGLIEVRALVEKPAPAHSPSTLAVAGRYVLTPAIFDTLRSVQPGAGGEIQLTDAITALLPREPVYAWRYSGQRYDCGTKLGLLMATVDLGETHGEVGAPFCAWLQRRAAAREAAA